MQIAGRAESGHVPPSCRMSCLTVVQVPVARWAEGSLVGCPTSSASWIPACSVSLWRQGRKADLA